MLLEPSYLPLNPGPSLTAHPSTCYYAPDSFPSPSSPDPPPSSYSIEALVRTGLRPFPVRHVTSTTTWRLQVVDKVPVKSIELGRMRTSDLEGVKVLHDLNLPLVYPTSFYTHLLISPLLMCLVARPSPPASFVSRTPANHLLLSTAACSPVGCISAQVFEPFRTTSMLPIPTLQILSLVVDSSSRRSGLARRLFKALLDQAFRELPTGSTSCDQVYVKLHVLERNEAAIALYRDLGLAETARCKGYYQRLGEDAIEMSGVVGSDS